MGKTRDKPRKLGRKFANTRRYLGLSQDGAIY